MIRSGKCYQNLMVYLKPTNLKLAARAALIVTQATGARQSRLTRRSSGLATTPSS